MYLFYGYQYLKCCSDVASLVSLKHPALHSRAKQLTSSHGVMSWRMFFYWWLNGPDARTHVKVSVFQKKYVLKNTIQLFLVPFL